MKRLVLLGGGHAHLFVLEAFAREQPDAVVSLVTPDALTPYSGMMPGVIAGHYDYRQACIDLAPLAARAGCALRLDAAVSLDAGQRQIRLASGEVIDYDMLSIDTGSTPRIPDLPGADTCAHPVKPIGQLLESWHTARAARAAAVVGAGAAGVEIIMALHHRQPRMRCTLIDRAPLILDGLPRRLQRRVMMELARQQIDVVTNARVSGVDGDALNLEDGRSIPSQFSVWATGAAPPAWLRGSGLTVDERGFIATGPTLESLSHPEVFAAGDVATMIDSPRPKSGVFAVRAGPPLAANLLRAARGHTLQPWTPQTQALLLLACGRRHAIASRGGWSLQGDWVWRWKDRIDRAFMRRFDL
ncbi:FAD-dependent oxidoreductase [Methyloversatilis sp. XJ19-13]|uniref:FAD-dependent oxidoreductase n=1 Tax=Methyloversatilis sp. XJ19-13 TaxID=2963430 RepID=UPI00211CE715|nr:FAD-dependent oxidoreductase [Methyloversatilis sp. XJ19-13]MCQ9373387.1 FAD-dependent oxidoreductase [Methyloversatilis sp. XJ19-13]